MGKQDALWEEASTAALLAHEAKMDVLFDRHLRDTQTDLNIALRQALALAGQAGLDTHSAACFFHTFAEAYGVGPFEEKPVPPLIDGISLVDEEMDQ